MSPSYMRQKGWVTEADDYVCTLREEVQKVALVELREDKNTRDQALAQFRDWIIKNPDIENCRLDAKFLLRFLRVKKFSLPMAQQTLIRYLELRRTFAYLTFHLDYKEPNVFELIESGYLFPLPKRDEYGRKVVIARPEIFDPYRYNHVDMSKIHMLTYETLLEDEENQVLGFVHVGDIKNCVVAQITIWSPSELSHCIRKGEKAVPMRHKAIHLMHVPGPLKFVYSWAQKKFGEKIRSRFMLHDCVEDLHKVIDPKILPKEYGGVVPMKEMIEEWKKTLKSSRKAIQSLAEMDLSSVYYAKSQNDFTKGQVVGMGGIPGSFRRLEVD